MTIKKFWDGRNKVFDRKGRVINSNKNIMINYPRKLLDQTHFIEYKESEDAKELN